MKKLSKRDRILIGVASLALCLLYIMPLWVIILEAPQYPEGMGLEIWINSIEGMNKGDLQRINNLNHYIGMKTINPESIPELMVMPYMVMILIILGLVTALTRSRLMLLLWLIVFLILAIAGFIDYYQWGYDYGHNLDQENASIKIPGMTYQPPLVGSKQLLNFHAISLPGFGGAAAMLSFLTGIIVYFFGRRKRRDGGKQP